MELQNDPRFSQQARGTHSVNMHSGPAAFNDNLPQPGPEAWPVNPQDALIAAPLEKRAPSDVGSSGDDYDNEEVFISNAFQDWECIYLKRLARSIHRLVCSQLEHHTEEALFMLFIRHDQDMDGEIRGQEVTHLLEILGEAGVAEEERKRLQATDSKDGAISFIALLEWYNQNASGTRRDTNAQFNIHSLSVGLLGSGILGCDARLDQLNNIRLRRNIVGYRRLLEQLRQARERKEIQKVNELESKQGLKASMESYYALLKQEFQGDEEHLFEIFSEVDESGNMMLEETEVASLLQLLDKGASDDDVRRYLREINIAEDGPLTFDGFVNWWEEAQNVPTSLIGQKGAGLIAGVRAEALRLKASSLFFETAVQRRWQKADHVNNLPSLRQAYCRTFSERKYHIDRQIRKLEEECAVP